MVLESMWADAPDTETLQQKKSTPSKNKKETHTHRGKQGGRPSSNSGHDQTEEKKPKNRLVFSVKDVQINADANQKPHDKPKERSKAKPNDRYKGKFKEHTKEQAREQSKQQLKQPKQQLKHQLKEPPKEQPPKEQPKGQSIEKSNLLKKKIDEQKKILKQKQHEREQKALLEEFLSGDSKFEWGDEEEEDEIIEKLNSSLKV